MKTVYYSVLYSRKDENNKDIPGHYLFLSYKTLNENGIMQQLKDYLLSQQEGTASLRVITYRVISKEEFDSELSTIS